MHSCGQMCNEFYVRANVSWAISVHTITVPSQEGEGRPTFRSNENVSVKRILKYCSFPNKLLFLCQKIHTHNQCTMVNTDMDVSHISS